MWAYVTGNYELLKAVIYYHILLSAYTNGHTNIFCRLASIPYLSGQT